MIEVGKKAHSWSCTKSWSFHRKLARKTEKMSQLVQGQQSKTKATIKANVIRRVGLYSMLQQQLTW